MGMWTDMQCLQALAADNIDQSKKVIYLEGCMDVMRRQLQVCFSIVFYDSQALGSYSDSTPKRGGDFHLLVNRKVKYEGGTRCRTWVRIGGDVA